MGGSIPSVGRTISWGGSHARESELSTSVHLSLLLDWGHTVTSSSRCDFHTRMDCVSLNCEPRQTLSPSSCFCRGVFFFITAAGRETKPPPAESVSSVQWGTLSPKQGWLLASHTYVNTWICDYMHSWASTCTQMEIFANHSKIHPPLHFSPNCLDFL